MKEPVDSELAFKLFYEEIEPLTHEYALSKSIDKYLDIITKTDLTNGRYTLCYVGDSLMEDTQMDCNAIFLKHFVPPYGVIGDICD